MASISVELIKELGPVPVLGLGVLLLIFWHIPLLILIFWYIPRRSVVDFLDSQREASRSMVGIKDALVQMVERDTRLAEKIDVSLLNQRLMVEKLQEIQRAQGSADATVRSEVLALKGIFLEWTKSIAAARSDG